MLIFARSVILSQILFCAGFFGNVGLAIAGPQVFILHKPIQPDSSQQVTYTATASDPQGIKSIVISVERRELKLHRGQKISDFISATDLKTCQFLPPFQTSETCTVTESPYSDGFHIGYQATATSGTGDTSTEGYIYFAAGTFPWPEDPIPIYVQGDPAAKIDLIFIPDKDYSNLTNWKQAFMQDVTALIRDAFFSGEPFARKIRSRREMWSFYITYEQGEFTPPCRHTKPSNWTTLAATVNAGFIVHRTNFPDCSGIGEDSVFSAEPVLPETNPDYERSLTVPIHELGHSVFSLADEYSGGYQFQSALPEHNVFPDRSSCWSNAQNHGWPKKNCKKIGHTGWYRSDDGYDIMEDTSSTDNKPGPSGEKRYDWHYDQCVGQNC